MTENKPELNNVFARLSEMMGHFNTDTVEYRKLQEIESELIKVKSEIQQALSANRLTSTLIKWVACKKCKKDYFNHYPSKCLCGSYEFSEFDAFLPDLIEKAEKWDEIQKSHEGISIFDLTEGYDRYKELEKIGYGGVSKKLKLQAQQIKELKEKAERFDSKFGKVLSEVSTFDILESKYGSKFQVEFAKKEQQIKQLQEHDTNVQIKNHRLVKENQQLKEEIKRLKQK